MGLLRIATNASGSQGSLTVTDLATGELIHGISEIVFEPINKNTAVVRAKITVRVQVDLTAMELEGDLCA
jgi:hypothetical protein